MDEQQERTKTVEKTTIKADGLDLELIETLNKNRDLLTKLRPIADLAIWIKFFILFVVIVFVLVLARMYLFI